MTLQELIDSLELPVDSRVDKRIPKKLVLDNASFVSSDKKIIQECIDEVFWIGALKPSNIGVLAFKDEIREYLEIAVISVKLRSATKVGKVALLVHRIVPYPVLLVLETTEGLYLSVAHKRMAYGSAGKFVVEELDMSACFSFSSSSSLDLDFLKSLSLSNQPRSNLFTLYQGWGLAIQSYAAGLLTGRFIPPNAWQDSSRLRSTLALHAKITSDITRLKNKAVQEKQLNRRVELNTEIKFKECELAAITIRLAKDENE